MAVLYRPIENVFKDLYNIEDYISSETYRKELEDMPLDIVLGLVFFLQFKQRIIESYEGLFQSGDNRNATFGGGFKEKWNWYQSIYTVAGGSV
jgi:hypothetical protein